MQTIEIHLPDGLLHSLNQICANSERVRDALLKELVIEHLENIEDYFDAVKAAEEGGETVTLEEMMKRHGLAH